MSGVNRYLWMIILVAGCHLGRPPASMVAVSIGDVAVASAEPGLEDALRAGLSDALAVRGLLGGGGPRVDVVVNRATTRASAVGEGEQVHTAYLEIAFMVSGPSERRLVVSDERSYGVDTGASLEASAARARAFDLLSRQLTQQAVNWIVYGPVQETP